MSINFYTIKHEGAEYSFETSLYGVNRVSAYLKIKAERIRRGSASTAKPLTQGVLAEMQKLDGIK